MSRSAIYEGIFRAVTADPDLLALLGPKTARNLRVYRAFPQLQNLLQGPPIYEPSSTEGWLIIEEVAPGVGVTRAQYDSHYEIMDIAFHVFAQTYGLADDVFTHLDHLFSWSVEQQRDVQYGDYYVFFSRAYQTAEKYDGEGLKLTQKTRAYRLELVIAEQVA